MDKDRIKAIFILDVIGRPPEHLIESLQQLIDEIDKEKGVSVVMKDIKKPTLMKDQKEFYTTFAEIEVEIEEMVYLAILLFKYMPAHIEIISPEILAMSNNGWNDVLNELARRLHSYDEIARIMQIEKNMLLKKVEELGGNLDELFKQMPTQKHDQYQEKVKPKKKQKKKK